MIFSMANKTPQAVEAELRTHFSNLRRFEYEGLIGHGSFGITVRIKDTKNGPDKRLAVKRSFGPETEEELRSEIRYLEVI
jgi:hypothetical protein